MASSAEVYLKRIWQSLAGLSTDENGSQIAAEVYLQRISTLLQSGPNSTFISEDAEIVPVNSVYVVSITDSAAIIEADGTFTVTLPDGLPDGFQVVINNVGTGTITLAAETTLQTKDAAVLLASQYGAASAYHRGSNVWWAGGDLT